MFAKIRPQVLLIGLGLVLLAGFAIQQDMKEIAAGITGGLIAIATRLSPSNTDE